MGTIVLVEAGSRVRKEVVGMIGLESLFSKRQARRLNSIPGGE